MSCSVGTGPPPRGSEKTLEVATVASRIQVPKQKVSRNWSDLWLEESVPSCRWGITGCPVTWSHCDPLQNLVQSPRA